MAYAKIRMQMVDNMYRNMLPVLQEVFEAMVLTTWGLAMHSDINFLRFSCLKYKTIKSMNARSAIMHDTNINIMLDSASSTNHESISSSSLVLSKLSMIDSLKSSLSFLILSEFDRYILFCLRSPMIVSNCFEWDSWHFVFTKHTWWVSFDHTEVWYTGWA